MRGIKSVVAVVVALALLAGAAVLVDRWARSETESRVEDQIHESLPELSGDLDVEVGGTFVLPQLIGGNLDELTLTSPEATVDGFTIADVTVVAGDVPIRGNGSVGTVVATGTAPAQSVVAAIQTRVDLPDGVTIELHDGELAAVASILGVPLEAYVAPVVQPRSIEFEVSRFVLGGTEVDASSIPFDLNGLLAGAAVDLDMLPEGIELTGLTVTDTGVDLVLEGTDVSM